MIIYVGFDEKICYVDHMHKNREKKSKKPKILSKILYCRYLVKMDAPRCVGRGSGVTEGRLSSRLVQLFINH